MSIYQDIVEWSEVELTEWQRDALRRIVQNGSCDESDVAELVYLCKKESGVPIDEDLGLTAVPIRLEDVPEQVSADTPVSLTGMDGFVNVNRIAGDAVLAIPESGLTVVFGNNGSGKSGYIRVLKKSCRARGSDDEEVYPNIYTDDDTEPSAVVHYKEGEEDLGFEWDEDKETPSALSAINVFDSKSAQIHVSEENELLYQPFGTDLVPALIEVVDKVAAQVRLELRTVSHTVENFPEIGPDTTAGTFLKSITADTTEEQIVNALTFSDADKAALLKAREQLATIDTKDPTKEIEIRRRLKTSLVTLKTGLSSLPEKLSKTHVNTAIAQREANATLTKAAAEAAKSFDGLDMEGVGGAVWKQLWESARQYSETVAYPGTSFPNLDEKCVLCHQDLSDDAKEQMQSFESFVKNDIQTKLNASNQTISQSIDGYGYIHVRPANCEAGLASLDTNHSELKAKCESFFTFYQTQKQLIIDSYKNQVDTDGSEEPADLGPEIDVITAAIDTEIVELEKQKTGEVSRVTVQKIVNELDSKRLAQIALPRVRAEIQRKNKVSKYEGAVQATTTTRMTNKATELSDGLSGELATDFVEEIRKLKVQYKVDVQLQKSRAKKGVSYHKVVSPTADGSSVPLTEILSEGEFRAVAMAAFMTEVNSSPSKSAIIFDDPVTSLDHERKAAIAKRIAEESKERQVVVFTHDLPFVFDLANAAKKIDTQPEYRTMYVTTGNKATGNIDEDLPWDGKSPQRRVKELRARLEALTAAHKASDPKYPEQVDAFNNKLRQTWEAAVEKILLHGVVKRFDRDIKTSEVRYLVGNVTAEDNQRIFDAIAKCGPAVHDTPEERTEPIPEPEELELDLANLDEWITEVRARHNAV
jgi:energy-coupling factor transporter ATP-binding protein EcfA2